MTFSSISASTQALTLAATIARLAAHPAVEGILLLGTTGTERLTGASDYDLLILLNDSEAPLNMVHTWIDERLTEVYCTPTADIARILAQRPPWPDGSVAGIIVRWLREGQAAYDRAGALTQAQVAARALPLPVPAEDRDRYDAWRSIGYDVAQTRRYLTSDDPHAQEAVDWRLLYGLTELQRHYFTVRRLPWRGEKRAVRYLAEHDPPFLALMRRCLAEQDRGRKVAQYEELACLVVAPVGELWAVGTTIVAPGPGFGATKQPSEQVTVEAALAY